MVVLDTIQYWLTDDPMLNRTFYVQVQVQVQPKQTLHKCNMIMMNGDSIKSDVSAAPACSTDCSREIPSSFGYCRECQCQNQCQHG